MELAYHSKNTLGSLNLEGINTRDLTANDALSNIVDYSDIEESGGVREAPTPQELAMEGESLSKQGEYKEAIPLLEAALESNSQDSSLNSVLWSLLGNAHFYLGEYSKAALCHSHDLAICCEIGEEKSKAQAYCNLGIAHRKSGYLQRAKLCYESYLEICEQLEDSRSISKANHNLGDLHLTIGRLLLQRDGSLEKSPEGRDNLTTAAMYFEKHMEFVSEHGTKAALSRAHASLGIIYELLRDSDKAIDHHQERLRIAQELKDKPNEGRAYCSIGNCLRAILQPDKAMECYKRGLSIASELTDDTGVAISHSNMASTYEVLGNVEESLDQQEKCYQSMKHIGSLHGQAMALSSMAKTYETIANINRACDSLDKLAEVQRQLKQEAELGQTLAHLELIGAGRTVEDATLPTNANQKKGGIFKKLKEKRAKKRSIVGPETMPFGDGDSSAWSTAGSPPQERKISAGAKKLNTIKQESVESRDGPFSSKDEIKGKGNETPTGANPDHDSPQGGRRRSWSHGKVPSMERDYGTPPKMTHSGSVTFSSSIQSTSDSTDRYVIHGPDREDKAIYRDFGGEYHKQTMAEIEEFLDTSGEFEPADLNKLQDWEGWMIASDKIVIQSTKESKLI